MSTSLSFSAEEANSKKIMKIIKGSDCLRNKNNVERLGYDGKTHTLSQMLSLATKHRCPLIIKDGRGKWYLKGQGYSYNDLNAKIDEGKKNVKYKNIYVFMIRLD